MRTRFGWMAAVATYLLSAAVLVVALNGPAAAQLANADWPMLQHDLCHTGQSSKPGPHLTTNPPAGSVPFWTAGPSGSYTPVSDKIKMFPVIGPGGIIYVGQGFAFCAINPPTSLGAKPTQRWCVPTNADVSASGAAVGADGTIYFGDRDNTFYALDANGNRKWVPPYNHGYEGDIATSPAISPVDGTIYFAHTQSFDGPGTFTALKPDGGLKWKVAVGQYGTTSSPAIGPDGLIYLGFGDGTLRAFRDDGTSVTPMWKQKVGTTAITASPVIGPDGTIYIGSNSGMSALALDPSHPDNPVKIKWTFPTSGGVVDQTAALSAAASNAGTLFFASRFTNQHTIYAINNLGNPTPSVKWKYGPVPLSQNAAGFPVIGSDGIVYVGLGNGVYAFSATASGTATPIWSYQTLNEIISSPAIGSAGSNAVLYLPSRDNRVYAISSPSTGPSLTNICPRGNFSPTVGIAVSPAQTVVVGDTVQFNASSSTDPEHDTLSFTWDFADGGTGTGPITTHTFNIASPSVQGYTVKLTVSDSHHAGLPPTVGQVQVRVRDSASGSTCSTITNFCDDFTRPDSVELGGPPGGPTWEEAQGTWEIRDVGLWNTPPPSAVPATTPYLAVVKDFSGANQSAAADFTSTNNNPGPNFGIVLRYLNQGNYYLAYRIVGGLSALRIAKVIGGVETVLGQFGVPNPTLNKPFRLRADVTGSFLTLKLDGIQRLSVSDTALSNGRLGVRLGWKTSAAPSYRVDEFTACTGTGTDCSVIQ
jgi:outer membrane protein assembly factor BamB